MATFTMYLKEITGEHEDPDFSQIGLSEYPIYDEDYRAILNNKIFDQFMNREIGQEDASMFRLSMKRFMNNKMPYYNNQYELSLIKIDPLLTVNMLSISDSTGSNEANGKSNNVSSANSQSDALGSQYPQTMIMSDGNYGTDGNRTTAVTGSHADATETQLSTQAGKVESSTKGYSGHAPTLILQARQALINVDQMILDEIEQAGLFFMLWNSGDEFTEGRSYSGY